jgi:hypothetical protein
VIIHDHLRQTICAHQKYDYNSRFAVLQPPGEREKADPRGSAALRDSSDSRTGGSRVHGGFRGRKNGVGGPKK